MFRLGLAELRAVFSFGRDSIEQPTPLGIVGTATPMEVGKARKISLSDLYGKAREQQQAPAAEPSAGRER
jgi:hypothetical protein